MISFEFNFWDNLFAIVSIFIGALVSIWIYKLSKQLSIKDKYDHEARITKEIKGIKIYSSIILANIKKYHPLRKDSVNGTYYKQGAELYTIIPGYGIQFILMPSNEDIPVGLVPFEWIEYVRDYDGEDNKLIVVCRFKGVKWFKNFKSPFKEINHIYKNPNYREDTDPDFLRFTTVKSGSDK